MNQAIDRSNTHVSFLCTHILTHTEGAIREGFDFVQCARALIRTPDWVAKIQAALKDTEEKDKVTIKGKNKGGHETKDVAAECTHCNMCVVATLDELLPARCVLRPPLDIEDLSK